MSVSRHARPFFHSMNTITTRTLECGCTLVTEAIPNVASVAMSWLLRTFGAGFGTDEDFCRFAEMVDQGSFHVGSFGAGDAAAAFGGAINAFIMDHDQLAVAAQAVEHRAAERADPGAILDEQRAIVPFHRGEHLVDRERARRDDRASYNPQCRTQALRIAARAPPFQAAGARRQRKIAPPRTAPRRGGASHRVVCGQKRNFAVSWVRRG